MAQADAKSKDILPEMVTITKKEHEELLGDARILNALRNSGVDNWEGWDFAMESLEE